MFIWRSLNFASILTEKKNNMISINVQSFIIVYTSLYTLSHGLFIHFYYCVHFLVYIVTRFIYSFLLCTHPCIHCHTIYLFIFIIVYTSLYTLSHGLFIHFYVWKLARFIKVKLYQPGKIIKLLLKISKQVETLQ